jgi:hypothetical protein
VWFAGVFAWLGLDLPEVLRGALAIAAEQALCGAFAFVLVSVSATLAQAVVFGVATTLLWGFGIELVSAIPKRSALFTLALTEANLQWSQVIGGTVIGTAAMLIAIYQHLTLRTIRSQILIVALVVGVVLLRPFPPLAFTGDAAVAETTSSVSTPELSIDLASIRSEAYSDKTPGGTDTRIRYSALLTQSASAVPIVLKPTKVVSVLTFPDGSTQQVSPRYADAWTEDDGDPLFADTPYPGIAATVGAILADSPPGTAGRYRFTFLQVREDVAAIRATQPAALDLTLHLQAYRHSLAARIPIDVGSRAGLPRHVITMVGTAALDNGIAVDIRETYISDWRPTAPTFYVLGNRRLNQAVLASSRWERLFRSATTAYSSPVVCTTRLAFLPRENSAGRVTLDRAWLEDAELLVLKPENLGRVLKSIRVENFTLARAVSAPRQP